MFLTVCNLGSFLFSAPASDPVITEESYANWLRDKSVLSSISGPSGLLSILSFIEAISYLIPVRAALNLSPFFKPQSKL
jgi:hypothetical protein